jgi:hypothetical protein
LHNQIPTPYDVSSFIFTYLAVVDMYLDCSLVEAVGLLVFADSADTVLDIDMRSRTLLVGHTVDSSRHR